MDKNLLRMFNELDDEPEVREQYIRAPFPYPGAKSRSIEYILPHIPYRASYIEPFGGSGIIMLCRKPSGLEVFNDRHAGIVAFYRCIRDKEKCQQLAERCELTIHSREEFLWCKATWQDCQDDVERAARWYYMISISFGSTGRTFGRAIKGKAQLGSKIRNNIRFFQPIHERLKNVQIENLDWRQIIADYDQPEAVFYLDPPYLYTDKGIYPHLMSRDDHIEMCERIFRLHGFVALSGYTNDVYDKYPWDHIYDWNVNVSIISQAFTETNKLKGYENYIKRGKATEVLWIKEAGHD